MPDPTTTGEGSPSNTQGGDGSMVPRERLNEVLTETRTLRERLATLEGRLAERSSGQTQTQTVAPEPKEYSRQQLTAAVAAGQITQEKADEIYYAQIERRMERKIEQKAADTFNAATAANRLDSELGKYRLKYPNAFKDDGNPERAKVRAEYDFLTSVSGLPASVETELAALRAAFGPADTTVVERRQERETHEDVMSGGDNRGGDMGSDQPDPQRPPKGLHRDEKSYYENAIRAGIYKDWNGVRDELKHAKKDVRARAAMRH